VYSPLGLRKGLLSTGVDRPRYQKLSGLGLDHTKVVSQHFRSELQGISLTTSASRELIVGSRRRDVKRGGARGREKCGWMTRRHPAVSWKNEEEATCAKSSIPGHWSCRFSSPGRSRGCGQ